jgi:hypothetical protein
LIASLNPLSVYIYKEGIARFCTERYRPPTRANLDRRFSHLTNTAVNVCNQAASTTFTQLASDVFVAKRKGSGFVAKDKGRRAADDRGALFADNRFGHK